MICQMFSPLSDVAVMFASRMYSFLENAGRVGVHVRLSNDIAQPLQVNTGGKVCIFNIIIKFLIRLITILSPP